MPENLESKPRRRFQKRSWALERTGWFLMAAFLATAGIFKMGAMGRAFAIYLFLLAVVRFSGKRTLTEMSPFDFILLLIIAEATNGALTVNDNSLLNSFVLITTLVLTDILLSYLKHRSRPLQRLLEDQPIVIVEDGKPIQERLFKERISENDILAVARQTRGLEKMDEIKRAVLECDGEISIIPRRNGAG